MVLSARRLAVCPERGNLGAKGTDFFEDAVGHRLHLGPFIMGLSFDTLGGYDGVLTAFMIAVIPLMLLSFAATPPRLGRYHR